MSTLLITGGTGSFGTSILRRYVNSPKFSSIIVFSRDEKKQFDLMQEFQSPKIKFIIGDTRDRDAVSKAMEGVDVVFHAAALKQVPSGEFFPMELVKTNILGTENVFSCARQAGVKKVVLLSTDKAVYPINAMGMTKALAEKLMTSYSRNEHSQTVFCAVRYGNVMASRGSVIPLFVEQMKLKKDITVTDPGMTRFMLSLDDAMNLVELAIQKGNTGDIFIQKAPAATIEAVATVLKKIFKSKSKIKVIGVRKGEKIHETLANATELLMGEDLGGFFRVSTASKLDYDSYLNKGLSKDFDGDYSSDKARRLELKELEELIRGLPYIKNELKDWSKSR